MRLSVRSNCVLLPCILYICVVRSLDVLSGCYKSCTTQWVVAENSLDVVCNESCKIEECYNGCKKWKSSVNSSCQEACKATDGLSKPQGGQLCQLGCSFGITTYIKLLKDEIGKPPSPYLVADSKTNDSVAIEWAPAKYANITYLVQYRNVDSHIKDWEYYDSQNPLSVNVLQIKGLHPFTEYRFRVAWILLPQYSPLISEESFVTSTTSYGVPTSAPTITSLKAISPTRISITWHRPLYPNGQILSYSLSLENHLESNVRIKEVSASEGKLYFMFSYLQPQTTYIVSVSANNNVGIGPSDTRNITTPAIVKSTKFQDLEPYLLFATSRTVGRLTLTIHADAKTIHNQSIESSTSITGIAYHMKEKKVFFSDSAGSIYVVPAFEKRVAQPILQCNSSHLSLLSVDWINNKLYMFEDKQISRCDLDGNYYKVVVKGFHTQLSHLHVDPYHGYLYWVFNDEGGGSLYRLDLHDIESQTLYQKGAQLIKRSHEMQTFAIDYINSRILYPDTLKNTVFSVSLDGSDANNIRNCSKNRRFLNVKSLATHNNLLFWTNGTTIFGEEYRSKDSCYYSNLFVQSGSFITLKMMHGDSQPYPVPRYPVENLQALFQDKMAKVFWLKPKDLEDVGKGAWRHWFYEVHLYDHRKNLTIFGNYTTASIYKIFTLTPNTTYSITVRPCSPGGKGEWSDTFTGRTLIQVNAVEQPYIIWATEAGLVKSDIVCDEIKDLLRSKSFNGAAITGIRWYQDNLFLNTNTSSVYVYQMSERHFLRRLETVSNAGAIALDWLAPKLYWSSRVQQMICRANLDGSQQELFPIDGFAEQLVIDSPSGHLYWFTFNSVRGSYLNGSCINKYMEIEAYSGKHIKGLALDFDRKKLYWMVRSYEGAFIYRSPLFADAAKKQFNNVIEFVGSLLEDNTQGPIMYFSDRLFWIHETKGAVVSDMQGKNIASYKELQSNNLKHFVIKHSSLQPYPAIEGTDAVSVVPDPIQEISFKVEGSLNNFTIVWSAVANVNYGEVFYDISLSSTEIKHSEVSREPKLIFPKTNFPPYTEFIVGVRAFTIWAYSKQSIVTLFSPMSSPSQPEHPRIFISHKPVLSSSQEIDAEFRWSAPLYPNGVILGYRIKCWYSEDSKNITVCKNIEVGANVTKYPLHNLIPNCIYNFQVQAYNGAGESPYTAVVKTTTSHERPIPKLLLAKMDAVEVSDLDVEEEHLLSNKATEPVAITYLARENKVFWLEKQGSLMTSQTDGHNTSLIRTLSSRGTSLTVDWIGRYLYWTENKNHESSIWMLDLNNNRHPHRISIQPAVITAMEVEPFSSKLIWSETQEDGRRHLKTSDSNGRNVYSFFHPHSNEYHENQNIDRSYEEVCSCIPHQLVGKVIAIDRSNATHPEVLWVDGRYGHIWASDLKGCKCRIIVNASENKDNGLPPTSITVDTTTVYWYNADFNAIYSIEKELKPHVSQSDPHSQPEKPPALPQRRTQGIRQIRRMQGIRQIRAIGDHLQSYPDKRCLYISSNGILSLINTTPSSLTLKLPTVISLKNCSKISMPTTQYSVYYEKGNSTDMTHCHRNTTHCTLKTIYAKNSGHNENISISGLQPFTSYSIRVAVSNYYNKGKVTPGPVNIFRTKEGVPYAPANVSIVPVTPQRLDVHWNPPSVLNGETVSYEVRWKMAGDDTSHHTCIYCHKSNSLSENSYTMPLENLFPETRYYIIVRSYSSGKEKYNDSQEVSAVTYSLPHNLTLVGANARHLNLSWLSPTSNIIIYHMLEICELGGSEWHRVTSGETSVGTLYNFTIADLQPKTLYKARLVLTYLDAEATFIWPRNSYATFQTLGDSPDTPGIPHVRNIGRGNYQVVWTAAFPNGGDVIYYLEYSVSEVSNASSKVWRIIYNGSSTHWLVEDLPPNTNFQFRVQAVNEYGKSDYSNTSEPFILPSNVAYAIQANEEVTVILVTTLSSLLFLASFLGVISYKMYKKHQKEKQIPHTVEQEHQNSDTELATLSELPLNGNFVHQNNALYSVGDIPIDEELASLPHIHREQIYVTKFLGSGAFGEVFEGIAHYQENEPPIKVAIKTLRKGATNQEKAEFLKEAKLMSNFKHDHILQLLGVCLNNNPNFIILELMEGGDLLTYLRSNRPSILTDNALTLDDLVAICVDVAKGCHCLEEMHFVHRDLAARNCLVSSHDRSTRVVKIGDFGLARDIYKNDYYRKEGEGLLPVRWMAPESLVDGVFTSQSDVWAFGVLLWEVMTLGQQPYPARTNLEVLHYVRTGGKLEKPLNCPDDLQQLMNHCWSYCPEGRPTFEYCLETLKELQRKSFITAHMNSVHNHNYLGHFHNGGIENLGYLEDEQQHDSGNRCRNGERDLDTWSTCSDPLQACRDVGNVNKVKRASSVNHPPLQKLHLDNSSPGSFHQEVFWQANNLQSPKYLEILSDSEDITDADGYEMPLPPIPSNRRRQMKKLLQYAELAQLKSPSPSPSSKTDGTISRAADTDSLADLLNLSYAPVCPTLILDYTDNKENIDSGNGIDRFYESGSECLNSPIITSALLKPKSSQNFLEQKLNSSGQDIDRWSVSTVSTVPCPNDITSDFDSFNHSGISSVSDVSGVELNYVANSSWC